MNAQGGYPNATTRQGRAISLRCGCWRGAGDARAGDESQIHTVVPSRGASIGTDDEPAQPAGPSPCLQRLVARARSSCHRPNPPSLTAAAAAAARHVGARSACWHTFDGRAHERHGLRLWLAGGEGGRATEERAHRATPLFKCWARTTRTDLGAVVGQLRTGFVEPD